MPRRSSQRSAERLEAEIQREILVAIGALPELRIKRCNVGLFYTRDGRPVRNGTPGEADLQGVLGPTGRYFALEVKSPTGRQSRAQRIWEREYTKLGAFYRVVRSAAEALAALDDAKRGRA